MPNEFRVVTLGDSVPWGQGLDEVQKYDVMVTEALKAKLQVNVTLERFAHSGATIGGSSGADAHASGEVPESRPTITQQCAGFTHLPETVDLVLMNGGINDVGVAHILNPLALVPPLASRIENACHKGMRDLLKAVSAKFTKPSCRVLVTGYYTILSPKSDPSHCRRLLAMHGVAAPAFVGEVDFVNVVVSRCEAFFSESTLGLTQAVAEANDARITFVPSGFTDDNAAFVPGTSLLFGLDDKLGPEDPVATERHAACDIAHPLPQILERELCYRASAGHPNPAGAVKFRDQILAALP